MNMDMHCPSAKTRRRRKKEMKYTERKATSIRPARLCMEALEDIYNGGQEVKLTLGFEASGICSD